MNRCYMNKKLKPPNINIPRILKLTLFALSATAIVLNFAAAWVYIYALTHPVCVPPPALADDLPKPLVAAIVTGDGVTLEVWYYPSQNGAAVIAMGGMTGSLGNQLPPVEPLLRAGYGVLQIEGRACGQPRSVVTLGVRESFDAEAALAYLLGRGEIDPERIGVFGFSMGAAAAIQAAARNQGFAAVLAEGGYFNLGQDMVEGDGTGPSQWWLLPFQYTVAAMYRLQTGIDPWDSSPVDVIGAISPRPLLLIYGEQELASGRGQLQFDAAGQPKEIWVVPGGAHGINHQVAGEEYARRVIAFFDAALLGR